MKPKTQDSTFATRTKNYEKKLKVRLKENEAHRILRLKWHAIDRRKRRCFANAKLTGDPDQSTQTTLLEISRLRGWVEALKNAGLQIIKNSVESVVGGRKKKIDSVSSLMDNPRCDLMSQRQKKACEKGREEERSARVERNERAARLVRESKRGKTRRYRRRFPGDPIKRKVQRVQQRWLKDHIVEKVSIRLENDVPNTGKYSCSNSKFICIVCKEGFDSQMRLKNHFRLHTGSEVGEVTKMFPLVSEKDIHCETDVGQEENEAFFTVYNCEVCSEKLFTIVKYRKHLLEKHNNSECKELLKNRCNGCSLCDEVFMYKRQLSEHQRYAHDIFNQCPVCKESIATQESFVAHVNETHAESGTEKEIILQYTHGFLCKLCGIDFKHPCNILTHCRKHHSEHQSPFQCDVCEQGFPWKKGLLTHKQQNREKEISCKKCDKKYKNVECFRYHKRMHKEKQPQIHCKMCNKILSNRSSYRAHILAAHKDAQTDRAYKCTTCKKTFAYQSALHMHKTTVCEKEKAKPATCPICAKVLSNYILLGYHKANVHKFGNNDENFCHLCNKTFLKNATLYLHNKKYHTANKIENELLICDVCGKGFSSRANFFNHWQIHREYRPYQCSLCSTTFKQRSAFYMHRKVSHKDENDKALLIIDLPTLKMMQEEFKKAYTIHISRENKKTNSYEDKQDDDAADPVSELERNDFFDDNNEVFTTCNNNSGVNTSEESKNSNITKASFSTEDNKPYFSKSAKTLESMRGLQLIFEGIVEVSIGCELNTTNESLIIAPNTTTDEDVTEEFSVNENMKNSASDEGEELVDYYASQVTSLLVHDEDELEDTKDLEEELLSINRKPIIDFPEDPFSLKLVVALYKLREYECSICDKIYYTSKDYNKHLNSRLHRCGGKVNEKLKCGEKYKCGVCEESFKESKDLISHCKEAHEGKLPFQCNKCAKGFVLACKLKRHDKGVHLPKNIKKDVVIERKPIEIFVSKVCKQTFYTEGACKNHEENHGEFSCDICDKCFTMKKNLKAHLVIHSNEKPFSCTQCKEGFSRKWDLKHHIDTAHLGKRIVCDICGTEFLRMKNLVVHMNNLHPIEGKKEKCGKCAKIFPSEYKLKDHMYRVHNENKVHTCTDCGKCFKERYALIIHSRIHTGEKPCVCEICNQSFYSSANLCTHRLHVHNNGKQMCELCGKELSGYSMSHHKKVCSGERPYKCEHCPAAFHSSWKKKRHIESEHQGKKHICEFCGKELKRIEDLTIHRRSHTGEMPYKCEQCPSAFPSAFKKRHHVQTVHLKETHLCPECDKEFTTARNLQTHRKIHAKDYNKNNRCRFSCSTCSQQFRSQKALDSHVGVHDSSRPFPCDKCPFFFNHSSNLTLHKKNIHQKLGIVYKKKTPTAPVEQLSSP